MSGISENLHTNLQGQARALSQENRTAPADEMTRRSNSDDHITHSVLRRGEYTLFPLFLLMSGDLEDASARRRSQPHDPSHNERK